ncbi:MAG: DUF1800 domain-containing protein [Bacteroidetes bacterium]|nr:DUF1800 domain-containing protein [Bacteroidota bacterium]
MKIEHVYHLYSRAGFGISISDAQALVNKKVEEVVEALLNINNPAFITCVSLDELPSKAEMKSMTKSEKRDLLQESKEKIKQLNVKWVQQMTNSTSPLLEKITLFWHGHFACHIENAYTTQTLHNITRQNGLGLFKNLLVPVSKSAAMLQFLNNNQNKKQHPNENFARELMELFTIGRDHYTEQDIKESARAFTGWNFSPDTYEFVLKEPQHDEGIKTFMGQSGNLQGEDIIDIILSKKQTAVFLCRKIYRFFVNETVNEKQVSNLADFYYKNNYDTGLLLHQIFTSKWFYDDENIGCNIKSPIEFIVGFAKQFSIMPDDKTILKMQQALGQVLFYPPNVAGWPGGKNWIDNSTLLLRLKTASVILNGGKIDIKDKEDMPEESFDLPESITVVQTKPFYSNQSATDLLTCLLRVPLDDSRLAFLKSEHNKQLVLKIVSMPEYQLC